MIIKIGKLYSLELLSLYKHFLLASMKDSLHTFRNRAYKTFHGLLETS